MPSLARSLPGSTSRTSRLPLIAALFLVVVLALSYVPLMASGGEHPEVWYEDENFFLNDSDEDDLDDTVSFHYDMDTDARNGTHVHVKLIVKDGEGRAIDDPVQEHFVNNATREWENFNWTAAETDNYTFEVKLYHGDRLMDHYLKTIHLHGADESKEGTVRIFIQNDYDAQYGDLYFDERKEGRYNLTEGNNDLGEFTLEAGEHHVAIGLANEAEAGQEFVLEDGDKINLTLRPEKSEQVEVWFKDADYTLYDTNRDDKLDSITFDYDIDTDAEEAVWVHVKLYVRDGEGTVIDDPVQEHQVENGTVKYHYLNWTAESYDDYSFELKLYYDSQLVERRLYEATLNGTGTERSSVYIYVKNDYDGQMADLYLDGNLTDRYELASGWNDLGEFELEAGDHEVYIELINDAEDLKTFHLPSGKTINLTLHPDKGEQHGLLELWVDNTFDTQWGDLYIDDELFEEYEVAEGEKHLENIPLSPGKHHVYMVLANEADDGKEVEIANNKTTEMVLSPTLKDKTINIEGSVISCQNCTGPYDDLHFVAHVKDERVQGVEIKVYEGDGRGEPLRSGTTNSHGYWLTKDLDPGRYNWEAWMGDDSLEEGSLWVYEDLNKTARGDIHGAGDGEDRHWDIFKVIVSGEGDLDGAKVQLKQGETVVAQGLTNDYGHFVEDGLAKGWYHYTIHWPADGRGDLMPMSASDVYSYGSNAPEPARLFEPWLYPMEGELDDRYNFSVFYKDPQGREPTYVKVYLDGTKYTHMTASGDDWERGVEFSVSIPGSDIGVGQHTHQFKAYVDGDYLHTEVGDGPFIKKEEAKPYIEILHPEDGAKLRETMNVTFISEARTTAPYDIELAYCEAKRTDGGRQSGGDGPDEPTCAPKDGGRQAYIDPWTALEDWEQLESGVVTYTYEWDTLALEPGKYLLRASIFDAHDAYGEQIIALEKPTDDPNEQKRDVALAIDPLVHTVKAGSNAVFTVTVTNTGDVDDSYLLTYTELHLNSSADGWEVTWSQNQVAVAAGTYGQVKLIVSVPLEASAGDVIVLSVTGISMEDTSVKASGVVSVIVSSDQSGGGVLPSLSTPAAIAMMTTGVVVASFRRRLSQ